MLKKGQVAIEYLILTAFLLVVVIIIFGYSFVVLNENSKLEVAKSSVRALVTASDQVSVLGPGNAIIVKFELPDNAQSVDARGHGVNVRLNQLAGISDVVDYSVSNITPVSLPAGFGVYNVRVEAVDENVVFTVVS